MGDTGEGLDAQQGEAQEMSDMDLHESTLMHMGLMEALLRMGTTGGRGAVEIPDDGGDAVDSEDCGVTESEPESDEDEDADQDGDDNEGEGFF